MTDKDLRVRQLAYRIWESEGRPSGQEKRHWEMALKIVNAERDSGAETDEDRAPLDSSPGGAGLDETLGEEPAPTEDRGASDYAKPEPPTAPAQAPVSPGGKTDKVIRKAEEKAKAAIGKATGKASKPKAPRAPKAKAGSEPDAGSAGKAPKTGTRKPKGSAG